MRALLPAHAATRLSCLRSVFSGNMVNSCASVSDPELTYRSTYGEVSRRERRYSMSYDRSSPAYEPRSYLAPRERRYSQSYDRNSPAYEPRSYLAPDHSSPSYERSTPSCERSSPPLYERSLPPYERSNVYATIRRTKRVAFAPDHYKKTHDTNHKAPCPGNSQNKSYRWSWMM